MNTISTDSTNHTGGNMKFDSKESIYLQIFHEYKKYIEYNDDGQLVGSYIYSEEDQYFVTYDSIEVVKAKYQYASTIRGMGLMWWCYQFDSNEFFPRALYEEIYG